MSKIELEGELFVLVEESLDREGDVDIDIEVCGINLFDWFSQNNGHDVKITLEKIGDTQ